MAGTEVPKLKSKKRKETGAKKKGREQGLKGTGSGKFEPSAPKIGF